MKVILDRVFTLIGKDGNPVGFGPGDADVPDDLYPQLDAAAKRRNSTIRLVETAPAAPTGPQAKTKGSDA